MPVVRVREARGPYLSRIHPLSLLPATLQPVQNTEPQCAAPAGSPPSQPRARSLAERGGRTLGGFQKAVVQILPSLGGDTLIYRAFVKGPVVVVAKPLR